MSGSLDKYYADNPIEKRGDGLDREKLKGMSDAQLSPNMRMARGYSDNDAARAAEEENAK